MLKLNILNVKNFFRTVNGCESEVYLLQPDGSKRNLNKQYGLQEELTRQYRANKNCLKVALDVRNPRDYFNIVSYYCGDC